MFNDKDKYQNILTQLHELNRTIVLNENDKTEQLSQKIDAISSKLENTSDGRNKKNEKFLLVLIIISLINMFFIIFIFLNFNLEDKVQNTKLETNSVKIEEPKKEIIDDTIEELLSFNEKSIVVFKEDEEFSKIKPIIRKGTKYTCKEDVNTYKIPYTVEIKGKLYKDRFQFILQKDNITKECIIKKEHM